MEPAHPQKQILIDLVSQKMPFGKYAGRLYCDLPEDYLVWFRNKGWPAGKAGYYMQQVYEIKANGIGDVLQDLKYKIRKK